MDRSNARNYVHIHNSGTKGKTVSFDDAILAGTTLVRDDIRSEGYVAGTAGWIIKRNGDAEFNDATVRGDIIVGDLNVNGIFISASGTPGIHWYANGSFQQTTSYNVAEDSVQTVTNGGGITTFQRNNEFVFRRDISGTGVLFDRSTGFFMYFSDDTNYVEEGWLAPSYSNSWGDGGADPGYRLMPDGTVRLRGHITGGTTTPGTAMFTLPVGYRPTQEGYFTVSQPNNNTNQGTVRVRTTGQVDCISSPATASLSLDQVSFSTV